MIRSAPRARRAARLLLAALAAAGAPCLGAGAQVTVLKPTNARKDFAWVGDAANYTSNPIKVNGVDIGRLDFSHRLLRNPKAPDDFGGLALAGGFTGTGNDPFPDFPADPNGRYDFVQSIFTNQPAAGRRAQGYVDTADPRVSPFYPNATKQKNPAGNAFTRGFFDAAQRRELKTAVNWTADLALVCTNPNRRNIGVIGSFQWGFDVAENATPGDGKIAVTRQAGLPTAFGPSGALGTMQAETRGTKTQQGWTVTTPNSCTGFGPPAQRNMGARSADDGKSRVIVQNPSATRGIDEVLVFPRNHALLDFGGATSLDSSWSASAWSLGTLAPDGLTMLEPGILFSGGALTAGEGLFDFVLAQDTGAHTYGHESFFDVFLHDTDGAWTSFAYQTQELLGDLDDDGEITGDDLAGWDAMFVDPSAYEAATGFDSLWRGDLDHDGALTLADRGLLGADVSRTLAFDAVPEGTVAAEPGVPLLLGSGLLVLLGLTERGRRRHPALAGPAARSSRARSTIWTTTGVTA